MPKLHIPASVGVALTLVLLTSLAAWRYDGFLSPYNVHSALRYYSMFNIVAVGMCFVIMTGGIDLSVGAVAALASVVSALASPWGIVPGLLAGLGAGVVAGMINGFVVTRLKILPFIATLAMMLAAKGTALLLANNQTVSASYDTLFTTLGQGDLFADYVPDWASADDAGILGQALNYVLGMPTPFWIVVLVYVVGWIINLSTPFGRHALAVGGGAEASKLMGLPVNSTVFGVYVISGFCSGLAGVILAAQFGAGQPIEGIGWELVSIASVVVGGTLLSGGQGSIGGTLAGSLLLGILYTILNFENGMGWISLSAYWQSVVRGAFLLVVVILQAKINARQGVRT